MAQGAANRITQLKAGQPVPAGARRVPGTYRNAAGYLRRRYQTGPRRYVEQYEHRAVARPGPGQDVDHQDRNKANNSRGNLKAMGHSRHTTVGNLRRRLAGKRTTGPATG